MNQYKKMNMNISDICLNQPYQYKENYEYEVMNMLTDLNQQELDNTTPLILEPQLYSSGRSCGATTNCSYPIYRLDKWGKWWPEEDGNPMNCLGMNCSCAVFSGPDCGQVKMTGDNAQTLSCDPLSNTCH